MTDSASLPAADATLMFQEAQQTADVITAQYQLRHEALVVHGGGVVVVGILSQRRDQQARGSSDHAATYAKYLFETQLGFVTASASPSVGSVYEARQKLKDALY
ncbi:MAG TPA: iron dicitrate transport regulator FecR, partial [Pseudoxanthomonas sp.]|nr:iron dicitrate transport regulator FecR [Pseudoxanthomonas sp.]